MFRWRLPVGNWFQGLKSGVYLALIRRGYQAWYVCKGGVSEVNPDMTETFVYARKGQFFKVWESNAERKGACVAPPTRLYVYSLWQVHQTPASPQTCTFLSHLLTVLSTTYLPQRKTRECTNGRLLDIVEVLTISRQSPEWESWSGRFW